MEFKIVGSGNYYWVRDYLEGSKEVREHRHYNSYREAQSGIEEFTKYKV